MDAQASQRDWLVAQIGWRELYACPVSLQRRGQLRRFYTDVWWPYAPRLFARMPSPLAALSVRHHPELPRRKVTAFTAGALAQELRWKLRGRHADLAATFDGFIEAGHRFGEKVVAHMKGAPLDPRRTALFAYSTGALEPLLHAKASGLFTVVDQLDTGRVDQEMVAEENARWPRWEEPQDRIPDAYFARLAEEWRAADLVVVNSNYSRIALERQGVPAEKLLVVPLCYEREAGPARSTQTRPGEPLRVLWLGQVILRKGIPYLFEAARLLAGERIEFLVAGRIGISGPAAASAPPNVRLVGQADRARVPELYARADVFVLPTLSDGFAITQIEAMSFGLPVIATPNCGDVVTPEEDGMIVPIRDPQALAAAVLRLHVDRELLRRMSANALRKSGNFTLERYAATIDDERARRMGLPMPCAPAAGSVRIA